MSKATSRAWVLALAVGVAMATMPPASGAMGSANYSIPFGSLGSGGGTSSSGSYRMISAVANPGYVDQLYGTTYSCIVDIDGNGNVDALTDGLMILRTMFGLTGSAVTANAVGSNATRTTFAQIQPMIHQVGLDLDGNGSADALTDGLMLLRALFGLTGTAVTNNAIGPGATRTTWTQIRDYLNSACKTSIQ